MRWPRLFAAVMLSACGGGGGGGGPPQQQVTFGFVRADAPTSIEVHVANPLADDATAEEGGGAGPFAPAPGALPAIVPAGGVLALWVTFTPDGPGTRTGQIRLRFVGTQEQREVVLRLDAVVETPMVSLLTPMLAFPPVFIGEARSGDLLLRNASQVTPVNLVSMSPLPEDFTTDFQPRTLLPRETLAIRLTYAPMAPSIRSFQVDVANSLGAPISAQVVARADTWIAEQVIDFGTVGFTQGNATGWLQVEVSPVAISLSIEAVAPSPSTNAGLLALEGPGGTVYETPQRSGPLVWYPPAKGIFSATLPCGDSPNVQLVPGGGTYRFKLYRSSGSDASVRVRAIVENRDGIPTNEGKIDLDVYLSGSLWAFWPAGTAPETDPKLQATLSRVGDILSQVNLHVGDVSYHLLNTTAYDVVGDANLAQLFAESSTASAARVNVFFVQYVKVGSFPYALGLAGAICGPKLNGTGVSGVVVNYEFGEPAAVGQVTAHEIGHYLGLYHTTEANGTLDTITDTLPCPAFGTNSVCTTEGGGYLMFWKTTGTTITPGQAHVILGHPLVDPLSPLAGLSALALRRAPLPAWVELPPGFCATCAGGK